jgi:prepilin-type N-terminal cleavage/methylation domain-containing protein
MRKNKGFTLIELLVVIAIIGILAAIVLVSLSGAQNRARDARIQGDINQIRSLAEIYSNDVGGNYNGLANETNFTTLTSDIVTQKGSYSYATSTNFTYCVVAKLNNGQYWCVDSNLVSKSYAASPATCVAATALCE